jgi:hypothetical protein
MQNEIIFFYQEMASEHRLQENGRGPDSGSPLCLDINFHRKLNKFDVEELTILIMLTFGCL